MKKTSITLVIIVAVAAGAVTAFDVLRVAKVRADTFFPSDPKNTQNSNITQAARSKADSKTKSRSRSRSSINKKAFLQPRPDLTMEERLSFVIGKSLFEKLWVSSPSSTTASDGLGPLFNARACSSCHVRNGRGRPVRPDRPNQMATSMMIRLSIPAQTRQQKADLAAGIIGVVPEPTYGSQIQDVAIQGVMAEGQVAVSYTEMPVRFGEATQNPVTLRVPEYTITQLNYGPLPDDIQMSPRIAPPMIGLGLLAAISEADILDREDPDDKDRDGISGRANRVWDRQRQKTGIGRFGWKASHPTLLQQNNAALFADIGISSPMFPAGAGECTARQRVCQSLPNGNSPHLDNAEASHEIVNLIEFYTRNIAVPARRNRTSPEVLDGEASFKKIGCESCHTASYRMPDNTSAARPKQVIWPYTDLLLHDMGEGLADHRPEFQASGREWRTPPLWGIGLTQVVSRHTRFLHDGRARNLQEAILWHGGEAQASKTGYMELPKEKRNNLITFLESL
ncbi:MAG: thiol oxidoreductase [Gammaproteobacteria bacterium]|nr:MAG: thiol oxidoreductase [Pseudomonadota bacterium]PIE38849.1 MAG: thiol oxidoreductase [Gammaproteobacteria bacterium]